MFSDNTEIPKIMPFYNVNITILKVLDINYLLKVKLKLKTIFLVTKIDVFFVVIYVKK